MKRDEILISAMKCVTGDRAQDYGRPEDNFGKIAMLWNDYLQSGGCLGHIEAKDVAAMMILLKVARIATGHGKADNWVDIAGYAACGGEIDENKQSFYK